MQLHMPARLPLGELVGDRGVQRPPDRGQRAGPQYPCVLGGGVADHGDAVVPVLEQAAGHRVQRGAGGGELDLAPVAPEQLGAQRRFQAADLLAEGRLRQVQALCGAGEVQLLGHGHEVPQIPEMGIHSQQLSQLVLDARPAGN